MKPLILQPTSLAQWHALVNEAEANCALELGEEVESYLVFLLMRFAGKPDVAASIMALEFLEGMHANGQVRSERLRDVGDKCLLFAGLFPGVAERRRLQDSYFIDLGQNAYYLLSVLSPHQLAALYQHLSEKFLPMREVLKAMRIQRESVPLCIDTIVNFKMVGKRILH